MLIDNCKLSPSHIELEGDWIDKLLGAKNCMLEILEVSVQLFAEVPTT